MTETCVRQRAFPSVASRAIYRVSFRILIALHKNDVARYGRGGDDGGGRDTYNSELSLRLSLSWQIKGRVVSAAEKERERKIYRRYPRVNEYPLASAATVMSGRALLLARRLGLRSLLRARLSKTFLFAAFARTTDIRYNKF